jgi:hypothetical protein
VNDITTLCTKDTTLLYLFGWNDGTHARDWRLQGCKGARRLTDNGKYMRVGTSRHYHRQVHLRHFGMDDFEMLGKEFRPSTSWCSVSPVSDHRCRSPSLVQVL